jgi:ABC-type multidrug transport system fused ATPase/permease subunit
MHYGIASSQNDTEKEADLLCGDSIVNYKTVQAFGHEDLVVEKYADLMAPSYKLAVKGNFKNAVAFGLTTFINYIMIGVMFWVAGLIMKDAGVDENGNFTIDP